MESLFSAFIVDVTRINFECGRFGREHPELLHNEKERKQRHSRGIIHQSRAIYIHALPSSRYGTM
jgi:hypothetical protein